MKKLMVVAAAALMAAGAFADDCSCGPKVKCPFGYQLKVFVKTTGPAAIAGDCGPECLRVPATKRFAGFIYGSAGDGAAGLCGVKGCACNEWEGGTSEIVLWNYDTKKEVAISYAKILQSDRIFNGDTTTFELAFAINQMAFGGFGRTFKRDGVWTAKYAAGFCAGLIEADSCSVAATCSTRGSKVWSMCANEGAAPDITSKTAVAYGKWTIDWSSTIFYRLQNGEQVTQPGASWEVAKPVVFK